MRLRKLRQPIHVSWLIALGCMSFVVGVWLALYMTLPYWWAALIGSGVLGVSLWRQRMYVLPFIVVSGVVIGVWYGSFSKGELSIYEPLINKQVSVGGRIKEDPSQNDKGQLVLQLDQISVHNHDLAGSVWVSVIGHPPIKRGDEVVVEGELTEGFGTFAGVMYTAKIITITHPQPGDIGRVVRDWFADAIRRAIPEPRRRVWGSAI